MYVCLLIQVTAPLYRAMETDTASTLEERYKDLAEEVIEVRCTRTRANTRTHKHTLSLSLSPTHAQHTHAHTRTHTHAQTRAHTHRCCRGLLGTRRFLGRTTAVGCGRKTARRSGDQRRPLKSCSIRRGPQPRVLAKTSERFEAPKTLNPKP